jgi:hypothetical protein
MDDAFQTGHLFRSALNSLSRFGFRQRVELQTASRLNPIWQAEQEKVPCQEKARAVLVGASLPKAFMSLLRDG